jgi:hypothetical protein
MLNKEETSYFIPLITERKLFKDNVDDRLRLNFEIYQFTVFATLAYQFTVFATLAYQFTVFATLGLITEA